MRHAKVSMLPTVIGLWLTCLVSFTGIAAAAPPTIGKAWVTGITPTNATLNAEINPNGLPTAYKLQIDTTGHFKFFQSDSCVLHPPGIICAQVIVLGESLPPGLIQPPESTLAASSENQHVSVDLGSIGAILQPGTTYHYRAIAANGLQVVASFDQTFTTPLAVGPLSTNLTVDIEDGSGTVASNPTGIECGGKCSASFEEGQKITLTASPTPGYAFKSWKGCDFGGANGRQCTVTMSSAKTVGVKFVKVWNLLTQKAGSGQGKVQSAPGGVPCLYNCSMTSVDFREGSVTLTATPAKHSHFVKWLGDCNGSSPICTLNMGPDHSVEAEFAPDDQYALNVSKEGGGQAAIKSLPSGINCGYTCDSQSASFYAGESVSVTVTLGQATTSLDWTTGAGTCTGNALACTVPMSEAESLVAKLD